ncbi:MAG: sterol desaturase family protein [Chitinophagales bacterium]
MEGANIMVYAVGGFVLLMLIEYAYGYFKKKQLYRLNDTVTNLNIGVGSQVFGLLYKVIIYSALVVAYKNFAIFDIPINVVTILLCAVLYDFLFYWAHRWGHEVNLFWGAHIVHHQSEEYNLSVALRQPWFHQLMSFFIFLPLPIIGFDPLMILGVSLFSTLFQFWIHTKAIKKMPAWYEFIFNSPAHHRVHHAVNEKYIDKNHGAVLIIWDRIFGTFKAEEEEPTYGITTQFKSLNPIWSNFHYYFEIWDKMKTMNFKNKIKMVFAKPGWTPDGPAPSELIKQVDLKREKHNPKVPLGFSVYVFVQLMIIMWGVVAYMNHFDELSVFFQWFFAGLIILSMTICSGIFEKKKWVFFGEYARILMIAFSINTFYYLNYMDWFLAMVIFSSIAAVTFYVWFSISLKINYKEILLGDQVLN